MSSSSDGWSDAIGDYLTYLLDQERSPHTIAAYDEDLGSFAAWYRSTYGAEPVLGELGAAELRAWKARLVDDGQAPASVNRRLAALRSLSRWAVAAGHAAAPVPKSLRRVVPPPRWLSVKEQHALIRAVERTKDPRAIAAVKVLLHTGQRIDELAKATWDQVTIKPRSGTIVVVGKGRKERTIPLNAEARAALTALPGAGERHKPGDTLFSGQRGPLGKRRLQAIVGGFGAAAKLDGFSAHVLRHTFCRRLAESGVRLEQIAALAGHESLDTTRRYVEPGREELAAAVERLAGGED